MHNTVELVTISPGLDSDPNLQLHAPISRLLPCMLTLIPPATLARDGDTDDTTAGGTTRTPTVLEVNVAPSLDTATSTSTTPSSRAFSEHCTEVDDNHSPLLIS